MHQLDRHRSLTDRGGHPFDRSVAGVAGDQDIRDHDSSG